MIKRLQGACAFYDHILHQRMVAALEETIRLTGEVPVRAVEAFLK